MRIVQLIQEELQPLRPDDTVRRAREQMGQQRVRHLPIVDRGGTLRGVVSDEQLRLVDDLEQPVAALVRGAPISVTPDLHVFDAARVVLQHGLTVLPVAESNQHYQGAVLSQQLLEQLIRMLSLHESGAILELEIEARDYALSNLLYCIEQCDARVRTLLVQPVDAAEHRFRVTLKLNVQDTARIRHVLEHRGFHVTAAYNEEDDEELRQRIEAFMRYLEV
ncbi:CBS domain-containing protein [Rhodothermus profundi]|uniref:CBS domain-containing protein n=1 Tax=Rhodothermus profundi TaxID=633813 RepID=A0A1M6RED8_9BACT|nr:CBS domain-containing protein [Rhodothermus profundi]SHK30728.1 CBS domain-containing protein [Rhodothermus profundi]